jgi:hypothetical protein
MGKIVTEREKEEIVEIGGTVAEVGLIPRWREGGGREGSIQPTPRGGQAVWGQPTGVAELY